MERIRTKTKTNNLDSLIKYGLHAINDINYVMY